MEPWRNEQRFFIEHMKKRDVEFSAMEDTVPDVVSKAVQRDYTKTELI